MSSHSDDRYARQFLAGWATMDSNGHVANTAYLDLAADARIAFFAEHGFPPTEFRRLGVGPVIRRDEVEYLREINLHDTVTVSFAMLALSPDGARFTLENEIWPAADRHAATVRSTGVRLVLAVNGAAVFILGLLPSGLLDLCARLIH